MAQQEPTTLPGLIIKHAFIGSIINASRSVGSRGIYKSFSLLFLGIVGEFAQQLSSLRDSRYLRLISRYIYEIYYDIKSNQPLNLNNMRARWLGFATLWKQWKSQDHPLRKSV